MPWWEKRMWIECLDEEFEQEPGEGSGEPRVVHESNSLDSLGITPREMK